MIVYIATNITDIHKKESMISAMDANIYLPRSIVGIVDLPALEKTCLP